MCCPRPAACHDVSALRISQSSSTTASASKHCTLWLSSDRLCFLMSTARGLTGSAVGSEAGTVTGGVGGGGAPLDLESGNRWRLAEAPRQIYIKNCRRNRLRSNLPWPHSDRVMGSVSASTQDTMPCPPGLSLGQGEGSTRQHGGRCVELLRGAIESKVFRRVGLTDGGVVEMQTGQSIGKLVELAAARLATGCYGDQLVSLN